jgi:hypothetical protein
VSRSKCHELSRRIEAQLIIQVEELNIVHSFLARILQGVWHVPATARLSTVARLGIGGEIPAIRILRLNGAN